MSTSVLGGIIASPTGFWAGAREGVGSLVARDIVTNNLCHYADEFAQVRVAWSAAATGISGGQGYTISSFSMVVGTYFRLATFGPFPITLRASGDSYKMRIRIGGASSAGHAVTFTAVLTSLDSARGDRTFVVPATDQAFACDSSSSTHAWLTGTSLGSNAYETMVEMSRDLVSPTITTSPTLTDVGGDDSGVQQALCALIVYGQTTNVASAPQLSAVYAAEWCGLT